MKKKLFIVMLLTAFFYTLALAQTVQRNKQIRQQLMRAVNSSKTTDSLYHSLIIVTNRSPLFNGYLATLQALQAKHSWNPYVKIKQVGNAEETFSKAIAVDPHNLELRFLRLSVEYHIPRFLGLSKNMTADKQEIFTQLAKKQHAAEDKDMVITVINFLLDTNIHTPSEKIDLDKQLAALQ